MPDLFTMFLVMVAIIIFGNAIFPFMIFSVLEVYKFIIRVIVPFCIFVYYDFLILLIR